MIVIPSAPTTSDRFQLVAVANVLPGACGICSGSGGPFINTGRHFKMHGTLLICMNCMTEMARLCGFVPADAVVIPDNQEDINLTYDEFRETVSEHSYTLTSAVNNLLDYLVGAGFVALHSESGEDSNPSDGDGEGAVKPSKQVSGSSVSEGPDGLSDDSGDGSDFFADTDSD